MIDVVATGTTSAPPERVWALLGDLAHWPDWSSFDAVEVERPGDPPPHGVGAIHVMISGGGKYRVREEVLVYEPPKHYAYSMLSGLPLRDYRADVTLTTNGDGTAVEWRSTFNVFPLFSPIARRRMRGVLQGIVDELVRAADASA